MIYQGHSDNSRPCVQDGDKESFYQTTKEVGQAQFRSALAGSDQVRQQPLRISEQLRQWAGHQTCCAVKRSENRQSERQNNSMIMRERRKTNY
jgi:hypothetical protein